MASLKFLIILHLKSELNFFFYFEGKLPHQSKGEELCKKKNRENSTEKNMLLNVARKLSCNEVFNGIELIKFCIIDIQLQ